MASNSLTKNLNKTVEEPIKENGCGSSQILNAKKTTKSDTLGHPYFKHSRIRNLLCCYRMMPKMS